MSVRLCLIAIISAGLFGAAYPNQTVQLGNSATEVKLLEQNLSGLTMEIEIGALNFSRISTREGPFVLITVDGFTHSHRIGEPNLPMVNRILAIPYGCELRAEVTDYEIEEISLTDLNLYDPLVPVQPSLSKSQDPDDVPFEYNRTVYQQRGYYSLPLTEISAIGILRALPLGMIEVSPIEYNPVENTIRVYKSLTIEVSFLHPDWPMTEQMQRRFYSPFFEPVYHQIFNYEGLSPELLADLVTYPVKYVIIADDMFTAQLQPFIEWKTKKGFIVVTGYTNVIGYDTASIHNFIEDLYNNATPEDPAPSFVLLVGDTPQIPTYDGDAGYHVTDLRYCEFTGDYFPEIYYGRFSAQNTSQLQPQIDKTLEYEQYTMPDPSYMAEVTLIAGVDSYNAETYGNGQINYGTNLYFNTAHGIIDHTWLYPASAEQGAAAAIIQTVNDGIGFINYTAHCGHTGFGNPSFTTSDIANLTNAHMYLLGIGNCCLSNTFDESTPCFGEAWLQAVDKGGVGYIGASNSTYWDEDYYWGVGYGDVIGDGPSYEETTQGAYDGVFHDHGEPVSEHYVVNDAIIYAGNLAVTESGSSRYDYYWEAYHLMGDPSVMNYMGEPSANTVSHLGTAFPTSTSYTVSADPGSYVGITFNGILHGAAYIGESGTVDVPITAFGVPGTADIVVTAQNSIPYVSAINIITPDGPYIVMDSYNINDNAGNANGLVDAGESIVLGVQLMNVGTDDANNVEATLSTTNSDITITTASESYGTIPANNGFINRPDAFAFDVAGSVPDGQIIPFELTVTCADRETWNIDFSLTAHSPILGYLSFTVDDATGDGDGLLEPGETGNLIVTLENTGSGLASSVVGLLTESDPYVSISDPNGDFGNILPDGGTADNSVDVFVVAADASCPTGYQMSFNLAVSGDGYSINFDFDFYVGSNLSIDPNSFIVITQPGNVEIRTLTINNDGGDPILFNLSTEIYDTYGLNVGQKSAALDKRPEPLGYHKTDSNKPGAVDEPYFPPIITGQGGPDDFGYRWIDSNEPGGPVYNWVDISDIGTPVNLSDDGYTSAISIGFTFTFYDNDYTSLYICSNGMLTFDGGSTVWINDLIPNTEDPNNFMAPWWDDLNPSAGGNIYYYYDSGNNRFIVSYEGVPYYSGGGSSTFQVILYPNGKITFQYSSMIEGSHGLNSATIGIESPGGTDGLEIVYNAPYMENNLAINIYSGWLSASPVSGTVNPHSSFDATITFDASMLSEGAYTGNINLASNDITRPSIDIPVSLEVTISESPIIGLNVAEISETVDAGSTTEFELQISNYGFQDLTYNISDDRTWISENPDNGTVSLGETDIVIITFDATSLTPGMYTGTVTVDSNDPENSSIDLPVSLLVTDPAQEIPTLSEWGMIIMALLLLAAGTIAVIRRRQVSIKKTVN